MRLVLQHARGAIEIGAEPIAIGAEPSCAVVVERAAPVHARVGTDGAIEALAPCRVGKIPLEPGERRLLAPGATIEIAGEALAVASDDEAATSVPTRELALRMVARVDAAPAIVVAQGPALGRRCALRADRGIVVGRGEQADLRLDGDAGVSRAHLEIAIRDGVVLVRDKQTTHGTFLGDARLHPERSAVWEPGLMLRVSDATVLAIHLPPAIAEKAFAVIRDRRLELDAMNGASDDAAPSLPRRDDASAPSPPTDEPEPVSAVPSDAMTAETRGTTAAIADLGARASVVPVRPAPSTSRLLERAPVALAGVAIAVAVGLLVWVLR